MREGAEYPMDVRIQREILWMISEIPRPVGEIINALDGRFPRSMVQDVLFRMLDMRRVHVTPDRKMEPAEGWNRYSFIREAIRVRREQHGIK